MISFTSVNCLGRATLWHLGVTDLFWWVFKDGYFNQMTLVLQHVLV